MFGLPNIGSMGASLLITLREGLEISLVLAILVGYLAKTGRHPLLRGVAIGAAAAALLCIGAGLVVHHFTAGLTGKAEPAVEGALALLAATVLTWMIVWMRRNGRNISGELRTRLDAANGVRSVGVVAFIAPQVGNEGRILANGGAIAMAAGDKVTLSLEGNRLLGLTIERGTRFFTDHARGAFALPEEDTAARLYELTQQRLEAAGLPSHIVLATLAFLILTVLAIVGMVGDLAESLIKRDSGRKDSSSWLPGLGGVLDMLDSLLLAAPVSYACWIAGLIGPLASS